MQSEIFILLIVIFICTGLLVYAILPEEKGILQKRMNKKLKQKEKNPFNRIFKNIYKSLRPLSKSNLTNKKQISSMKLILLQSGLEASDENVILWEGRKIVNLILGLLIALFLLIILSFTLLSWAIALFIVYFTYNAPILELHRIIRKRQNDITKNIADAVDLLSICVQAGLGLDASIERVATDFELTSKTISEEFSRLSKDILSGVPKQEAYKNLALRNNNKELQTFVALLIQTDKLGTSITSSLEAYSDSLRTRKRQRLEEIIQTASVKMTIPMVIFMLIPIFIIIMYPAFSTIMKSL